MKTVYTELRLMWRYKYFCSHSLKFRAALTGIMLVLFSFMIPFTTLAQQPVGSSTVKANFGVDADVYANRLQFPPLFGPAFPVPAVGTDDFFENQAMWPGPGMGVIGTTAATVDPDHWNVIDASTFKTTYCQSSNIATRNKTYVQRMSQPFGFFNFPAVWLDAVGARDNFASGNQVDSSAFTGQSNKNGDNPMTWSVGIGGVPGKDDIIDVGAHIRYDVTAAGPQNPNGDLWGFAYATALSADGSKHLDFEIYRAPVEYDPAAGFSNFQVVIPSGMNNYLDSMGFEGGHTAGLHALDGTTLRPGDLLIAVDFENGGTQPFFSVRIWVNPNDLTPWNIAPMDTATFNALPPAPCSTCPGRPFTFTGVFDSGNLASPYGWAEIVPNDLSNPLVFGRVNTSDTTQAAPWGNAVGSQAVCSDVYETLQLSEMGINFSAFGLGINPPSGPCFTLFGTLLVKSRSSHSFTSELKDFSGPYIFGNFSSVQVTTTTDTINCDSTTAFVCASATSTPGTLSYVWSGPCILAYSADSSCIQVGCAGDYVVQVSLNGGCFETDTATVIDESVPATCSIDPAGPFCPGTTNEHCGPAGQSAYQWSISGNGTIQGSSTSQCVTVLAGATCGSYTLELIVGEDACEDTCDMTFSVDDQTAPVISGVGQNATIECPATPSFSSPTATDDCDPNPSLTFNDVTTPGACPQEFSVTRTWTATDACGNSSTASQTINVTDNTAPVISGVGQNATIECPATPSFSSPTATDACDPNPSLTFNDVTTPGACPQEFSVTRTWTATDACGNSSTASQTINVTDNTAPLITCAANDTVDCNEPIVFGTPTATDACDPNPTIVILSTDTISNSDGSTDYIRTWEATDACGNSSTCSQTIHENACDMHCTLTQGAYGNAGGKYAGSNCDSLTTTQLLNYLLGQGNLVLGGGANTLTFFPGDAACIIQRLPGGGPAKKLNGAATCANPVGIALQSNGRFKNVLVAQTLTLGLNMRWPNSSLGSLSLDGPYFTTMASTSCEIGQGDTVPGTAQTFQIPQSVLTYLGANNTVADLYALANAALAGTYVPGPGQPSLSAIVDALAAINEGFDECRILIEFSNTAPAISNNGGTVTPSASTASKGVTMSAYPNPFNANTTITFKVDVDTNVLLDVYTLSGTKVATLYEGMVVGGKVYNVNFKGQTLHDGVYIYKLNTPDQSYFDKLILIK